MTPPRSLARDEYLILGLFLLVISVVMSLIVSGNISIVLSEEEMIFYLIFLTVVTAVLGGVVATYSFVAYRQYPEFQYMVLGMLGIDIFFIAFAFLFTHPSSNLWISLLSDHQRNRSIIVIFGISMIPSILSGAFMGKWPILKEQHWIFALWGGIIVPTLTLWFTYSEAPVIRTSDVSETGGILNATPIGGLVILLVMLAFIIAFTRYLIEWLRTGNRIVFSVTLAIGLWILSLVLLVMVVNPYTVLELIWYGLLGMGFLIIAAAMVVTSIIEPHKNLNELVNERTRELYESEQESSFYLDLWSHRIGNILQSVMMYIELMASTTEKDQIFESVELAKALAREADLINRQVNNLVVIKQTDAMDLRKLNLNEVIETIKSEIEQRNNTFTLNNNVGLNIEIVADDLVNHMFTSLFVYATKRTSDETIVFDIGATRYENSVSISIHSSDRTILSEVEEYLNIDYKQTIKQFGLELFILKMLLRRYNCTFSMAPTSQDKGIALIIAFHET